MEKRLVLTRHARSPLPLGGVSSLMEILMSILSKTLATTAGINSIGIVDCKFRF